MSGTEGELPELVRRAAGGERTAADELVRQWTPAVRAAVQGRLHAGLRPRFDTDDVVQSTMAVAIRDMAGFEYRDERSFRAWLLRIAERRLRMAARRHQASRRDVRVERRTVRSSPAHAAACSASEVVSQNDERQRVRQAVARLDDTDRRVVELRGYRGLPYKEIAAVLGLPSEDAARVRFRRALAAVQESLRRRP